MSEEDRNILKTEKYSSQSAEDCRTQSYGTQTDSRTDRTGTHNLGAGDGITLAGAEYRIERIISGEKKSGEAVIYLIQDNQGNDYAFKLYYPFRDPRDEPNSEALKRIKDINNPDILKLHHFGTEAEKFNGQFCYEICDFAKGGDLLNAEDLKNKYTPEFIERHVIREIFKGIQVLHQNRIYHCDLKPQNVFYRDEQQTDLVVGDYGSAKTFEQSSEKELSYMSVVKGTDFYLAPEQAIGIISEKNDYYSFGMIILHLLYPEKIDQQTLRKIYERRAAEKPIIDYNPKYKRLNNLIAGLTLQDIQQRWGAKEVKQWLAGKVVAVQYKKAAESSVMPIKLGSTIIQTEEDLISYVSQGEEWYRYLIEDEQGYHLLLTWISQVQDLNCKQSFDKLLRAASNKGIRFAQEAILRYFQPDRPVRVFTNLDVFGAEDVDRVTKEFIRQLEDQWKITQLTDMSWHLFCFGMALEQYGTKSNELMNVAADQLLKRFLKCFFALPEEKQEQKINPSKRTGKASSKKTTTEESALWDLASREITDDGLAKLFHEFNPERLFRDLAGNPLSSLEDIGLLFASNLQFWNNRFLKAERVQYLILTGHSQLNNLTYDPFLLKVFEPHLTYDLDILSMNPDPESAQNGTATEPGDGVELEYRITRSADVFLTQKNIREPIREIIGEDRITIKPIVARPAGDIVTALLLTLEKKFDLPGERWTPQSVDYLRSKFMTLQDKFKKIADIEKKIKLRSDIGYAVKSFFFLIPVVFSYFLCLAFYKTSYKLINFLSSLTPFDMSFEHLYFVDEMNYETGASLLIYLFIAILPALLLALNKKNRVSALTVLIVLLLFPGIYIVAITPLPSMMLMLITTPVIIYTSQRQRLRLLPFIISLVPAFLLGLAGDYYFRDSPPSAGIPRPLNYAAQIKKPASLRTGPSEKYAVIATTQTDTVNVIAIEHKWGLIRYQNKEGYVPYSSLKLLPIMQGIVHKRNPYLMSAPSYDSATVETISKGTRVDVLAAEDEWYLVRIKETVEGYLHRKDVLVKETSVLPADPFTDPRDGRTYKTVKIGDKIWMAENLNYDAGKGSWCYKNNRTYCAKYGRLYDWEATNRAAPPGWRLPTKDDFETLLINLGGAGTEAYPKIIPGESPGFKALFGGHRSPYWDYYQSDYYGRMDLDADFWSSTESDGKGWKLNVSSEQKTVSVITFPKTYALSVRLVRD